MQWTTAPIRVPDVPLLTLVQVAAAISYSTKSVRQMVKDGSFPPPVRIGHSHRWTAQSVGVWLAWQEYVRQPGPVGDIDEEAPESGKSVKSK